MTTWITATVLKTLADRGLTRRGSSFLTTELDAWVQGQLDARQSSNAKARLVALEFITHHAVSHKELGHTHKYVLTEAGAAAVAEAAAGKVRKSGPMARGRRCPVPSRDSLVWKLWDLLRIRKVLESDTATELLCDAGNDNARVQGAISRCLREWARRGVLTEAKRRVHITANSGGQRGGSIGVRRYVLNDEYKAVLVPPPRYQRGVQEGRKQ